MNTKKFKKITNKTHQKTKELNAISSDEPDFYFKNKLRFNYLNVNKNIFAVNHIEQGSMTISHYSI